MSPKGEIRLSIVMPVYGNWVDTLATLRALDAQESKQFRVLIADDGSPSEAPAEIHQFGFTQYDRQVNVGFAANCNRAARMAVAQGATHLLFLNNDTEFSSQFVGAWLRTIAERPEAIISPIIYWFRKPESVWYSGGKLTVWTPFVRLAQEFPKTTKVDVVCGCALLIPVTAWHRLAGFDETFKVYFEDFDLALRAKALGIPVLVGASPELHVWHKVSGSFRGEGAWAQQYHLLASRLKFVRRHFTGAKRLVGYSLTVPHLFAIFLLSFPELPNLKLLWNAAARGMKEGAR